MDRNDVCTRYEAASVWALSRNDPESFDGLILVVDLDQISAGLCRCQPGELPHQIWEAPGRQNSPYFVQAAQQWIPEITGAVGADALSHAVTDLRWIRSQKAYLRAGKLSDVPLPSLTQDGQVYTLTCAGLDDILVRHWDQPLSKVLAQAKEQLGLQDASLPHRIVPIGQLARLFLAEYRIREAFLEMPLLPDPMILTCAEGEDPSQIVAQGEAQYRSAALRSQEIPFTLRLQVQHRVGTRLVPELLTLVEKGATPEQLQDVTYVGPILMGLEDGLTLFADSQMHQISAGALRSLDGATLARVEIGVGMAQEELTLFLRDDGSTRVHIPLTFIR